METFPSLDIEHHCSGPAIGIVTDAEPVKGDRLDIGVEFVPLGIDFFARSLCREPEHPCLLRDDDLGDPEQELLASLKKMNVEVFEEQPLRSSACAWKLRRTKGRMLPRFSTMTFISASPASTKRPSLVSARASKATSAIAISSR